MAFVSGMDAVLREDELGIERARFDAYRNGMVRLNQALVAARCRVVFITPPLFSPDDRSKDPLNYDG
ncbi:MAG: hypothetical protein ACKOQ9_04260, partial [Verrucomicrobiota bacterium]